MTEAALNPSDLPANPAVLADLATRAATDVAAHLVASLDGAGPVVETKSTITDLVTDLDRWSERRLTELLLDARPDDGVEGEEGAAISGTSGITWCVDPIDGTVNFVHGLPAFCVSVAARVDGRSIASSVVAPLLHDTFQAHLGGGATRNGAPIRCASATSLPMSVLGTGFAYDPARRREQAGLVASIIDRFADIRRSGSAAVDLCWVACGRLDGYWELGLNEWDHAGGSLIAAEAGARVEVRPGGDRGLSFTVAAAPGIWDALNELLDGCGAGPA